MIKIPTTKRSNTIAHLMPDLTPLLDVMFMLIVFFILTANAVPYALDVNLPQDVEEVVKSVEDPDMLTITLLPGVGGWKINDTSYQSEEAFKQDLQVKTNDNKQVIIIGDKAVSIQKLLTVLAFLRKHNIKTADIVMKKK